MTSQLLQTSITSVHNAHAVRFRGEVDMSTAACGLDRAFDITDSRSATCQRRARCRGGTRPDLSTHHR
jgi:hypothetical protein